MYDYVSKELPEIINNNFLYIDKTEEIYQLTQFGGYYFYARPRRFGKSLMLSTIKSLYQGKKELFKGLWIEDEWDWSKINPVIHIGFSGMGHRAIGLENAINQTLDNIADDYNLTLKALDYTSKFMVPSIMTPEGILNRQLDPQEDLFRLNLQTDAKVELLKTYLSTYLNIISRVNYYDGIFIYDLLCGEGKNRAD